MKNISKLAPLIFLARIDKWLVARTLQIVLFCLSVGMGVAYFFNFTQVTNVLDFATIKVNIPIASDWIGRVTKAYWELTGLTQVLQFAWLSVLLMVCVNLYAALPELQRNQKISKSLGGDAVRSVIHPRLYHTWFRILSCSSKEKIKHLDKTADQTLIAMNMSNLGKQPAIT